MIAPGMVSDEKKIIVAASAYSWQFNSPLTAVSVDIEGSVTSLVPPDHGNTPTMLFAQPEYQGAVIGLPMKTARVVAYESEAGAHAFPAAFPEPNSKVQPARLTIPTLLYDSGRRVYFFQERHGMTPLPPLLLNLRRLARDIVVALPTPFRETLSRWEVEPNDWGNLTLDPFLPERPAFQNSTPRMGRPR
jgi:hypothetical protein